MHLLSFHLPLLSINTQSSVPPEGSLVPQLWYATMEPSCTQEKSYCRGWWLAPIHTLSVAVINSSMLSCTSWLLIVAKYPP